LQTDNAWAYTRNTALAAWSGPRLMDI
jgi:hypothetical protein